jgi:hypothetical protein
MKKMFDRLFKIGLISSFVLVFCTACNGTITRAIRHAGFSVSSIFACSNFLPADKDDTSYEKIKYMLSGHIINEDGKIYELSLSQTYSNNENCKEADTSIVVQAIFDNTIVKGTDGKYYYLTAQNSVASYSEVPTTDNSYNIYNLLLKDDDVVKAMTADSSTGLYYVLKSDGNIYGIIISQVDRNSLPVVTSTSIVFDLNDYGSSKIIDFNYAGDSLNTYVKTENKVYRMRITNSDTCSKYADVACEYSLQEDELFEEYKDSIISYNGSMLITTYGQEFNVAS